MTRAAAGTALVVAVLWAGVTGCGPPEPAGVLESSTATGAETPGDVAPDATTTPGAGAEAPLAVVTLFTDFRCRHCPRAIGQAERLVEAFPGEVQVQYRQYPLSSDAAEHLAARAALAAHRQEGFARMRDRLFATADVWGPLDAEARLDHFAGLAGSVGLDSERLRGDMADPALAEQVRRDAARATLLGTRGTPAFYVAGRLVDPREGVVGLIRRAREAIRAGRRLLRDGVPRRRVPYRVAATAPGAHPSAADWLVAGLPPGTGGGERAEALPATPIRWDVTVRPDDPHRGDERAAVTLVVFEDLESPFARALEATLRAVEQRFVDRVRVVFKALPLPHHARALPAARMLECARRQGRFHALREALLREDASLDEAGLDRAARRVGLEPAPLEACLAGEAIARRIAEDRLLAERVAARGAPITYVQGRKVPGAPGADELGTLVAEELERAERLAPEGADADAIYRAALEGARTRSPWRRLGRRPDLADSTARGPDGAPVEVVLWADLSRTPDRQVARRLATITDAPRGPGVALHLRPLAPEDDPRAEATARALLCARRQGRPWPYHDALLGQREATPEALGAAARRAGLDAARFDTCLEAPEVADAVRRVRREARTLGIEATPALLLGDRLYDGSLGWDRHALRRLIGLVPGD